MLTDAKLSREDSIFHIFCDQLLHNLTVLLHAGSTSPINHLQYNNIQQSIKTHYTTIYKTTTYPKKYPTKPKPNKPKPNKPKPTHPPPMTTGPPPMTPHPPQTSTTPLPTSTTPTPTPWSYPLLHSEYTTPKYYPTPPTYTPPPTYTTTYPYKTPIYYGSSHKHVPFSDMHRPTEKETYGEEEKPTSDDVICKNVVSKGRNWCRNHKMICSVCSLRGVSFW